MNIVILCQTPHDRARAEQLATQLSLPMVTSLPAKCDYFLRYTASGLQLGSVNDVKQKPLQVDFLQGQLAYRQTHSHGIRQPLARAVGCKPHYRPRVLDATAGLGRDAFLLAALGCEVLMLERSPIMHALLADGLARLQNAQPQQWALAVKLADAREFLDSGPSQAAFDVIYLDPMYPERRKSALVKKAMRWVKALVGEDTDAAQLLTVARASARKRVVVKRPKLSEPLGQQPASVCIRTPSQRFDVYLLDD